MINAGILGYGTVGSGVAQVLQDNASVIAARAGQDINVKYILDLREFPGDRNEKLVVHDFDTILSDPEVEIICETMGGTKPAYEFTRAALSAGKSVCTSNKELVEAHGAELLEIARQNDCRYLFEASVGGGIPIIRTMADCLTTENIQAVTGILNGTTNYILTRMDNEGAAFETVLKDAQANGYAEKDPTADIEGHDACRKIAILTSLVLGKKVDYKDIYTEGITGITTEDFAFARAMDCSVKLLGLSRMEEEGAFAMVAPFMISREHPLYLVSGVFNAVHIHSDMLDDSMYYGRGAGKLPTASAVCADVVECVRRPHETGLSIWSSEKAKLIDRMSRNNSFFVRIDQSCMGEDEAIALFGEGSRVIKAPGVSGSFGVVTGLIKEKDMEDILSRSKGLLGHIRML